MRLTITARQWRGIKGWMQADSGEQALLAPQAHVRSHQFDCTPAELMATRILDPHVKQADKEQMRINGQVRRLVGNMKLVLPLGALVNLLQLLENGRAIHEDLLQHGCEFIHVFALDHHDLVNLSRFRAIRQYMYRAAKKIFDACKRIFRAFDQQRIIHAIYQGQEHLFAHRLKQVELVAEMPVYRTSRNTGPRGNMLHCGTTDTVLKKNLPSRVDQSLARQFRIFFRLSYH
jgi:hypothetical protein